MHVLILSSNIGGGYQEIAYTVRESLEARGNTCEMMDCLSFFLDTVAQRSAKNRKLLFRLAPELFGRAVQSGEQKDEPAPERGSMRRLLGLGAEDLGLFLQNSEFDLVICTHAFIARMVLEAVETYGLPLKTAVVAAGETGVLSAELVSVDYYLVTDGKLRDGLLDKGVEPERIFVLGGASSESAEAGWPELPSDAGADGEGAGAPSRLTAPTIQSTLRHQILKMPEEVYEASGIIVNGRRIKSLLFSTDLAIIRNCDADAIFAVYPFTPQQAISEAIIKAAYVPVFCGVGGGTTKGARTVGLAKDAEAQGAMGIVLNAPISNPNLRAVAAVVDIPVVITVVSEETNIARRLDSGAAIINVAGAAETPNIVRKIRSQFPNIPIIASGGSTGESIRETVWAGANAITFTPPSTKDLFRVTMSKYREM